MNIYKEKVFFLLRFFDNCLHSFDLFSLDQIQQLFHLSPTNGNKCIMLFYINSPYIFTSWSIYQKEQTLRDGQLVLFELAPVDPRSLMQGDYMSLRYREATSDLLGDTQVATHGYAVLNIDSNRVARIVRLKDALEPLNDNELIINYKIVNDRLFLGAESFFFEEGQDTLYQKATYGGLKVNAKGESLLVGLYDKDFLLIKPDR